MPIRDIQRRHAELGRIRLGRKVAGTRRDGSTYFRPERLDRFRFTSPNQQLVESIANLYGGTAAAWDNNGKGEFEVVTDAKSIPVIVVKGGLSQWMETWSAGGCIHRCDGYHNVLTDAPCDHDERVKVGRDVINPHAAAQPHTRLSLMLRDVESLGVWRMETKGWNAACEIPAVAELAMFVGDLVPANLHLVERRIVKDGETSRFVVPVLDLAVSKQRLVELVGGHNGAPALEAAPAQAAPAIEAPRPDYRMLLEATTTVEECQGIWRQAGEAGHLDDELKAVITDRVQQIKAAAQPVLNEDGTQDAEVVDDSDRDAVWMTLVMEAGKRGITDSDLRGLLEQEYAQPVEDLEVEQLRGMLAHVKNAPVTA